MSAFMTGQAGGGAKPVAEGTITRVDYNYVRLNFTSEPWESDKIYLIVAEWTHDSRRACAVVFAEFRAAYQDLNLVGPLGGTSNNYASAVYYENNAKYGLNYSFYAYAPSNSQIEMGGSGLNMSATNFKSIRCEAYEFAKS